MTVALDPAWDTDPSPSWIDIIERVGPGAEIDTLDDPYNPTGDIVVVTAKLWPEVHPALQEARS